MGDAFDSLQDHDIISLEELLKYIKDTYTEQHSLSQLNKALAMIAQLDEEKVLRYGSRVNKILANLIELIEDNYTDVDGRSLIKTARETARDCFCHGFTARLNAARKDRKTENFTRSNESR